MPPFFSFWGLGKIFGLFFWAESPMPIAPQRRHWMWASGHNGYSLAARGGLTTKIPACVDTNDCLCALNLQLAKLTTTSS
jgi:hypothetical protein